MYVSVINFIPVKARRKKACKACKACKAYILYKARKAYNTRKAYMDMDKDKDSKFCMTDKVYSRYMAYSFRKGNLAYIPCEDKVVHKYLRCIPLIC